MIKEMTQFANEEIFADGDSYFSALFSDIERAKKSIDLETFIFNHDDLGKKMAAALITAAERGVAVRVLVDGAGCPYWSTTFAKKLENAGIMEDGERLAGILAVPWPIWTISPSYTSI